MRVTADPTRSSRAAASRRAAITFGVLAGALLLWGPAPASNAGSAPPPDPAAPVMVVNQPPTAALSASTVTPAPWRTVTFDAAASSDPDGTALTYTWDLDGDGSYETTTGDVPRAVAAYPPHAARIVHVAATDADGESDTAFVALAVRNQAPHAELSAPTGPARPGDSVVLSADGSADPDADALAYEWDLDGDGTFELPSFGEPRITTSFAKPGARRVRVRVADGFGQSDVATARLDVTATRARAGHPPTVMLGTPRRSGPPGAPVTLTAAAADPDGDPLTYQWDLGALTAAGPVDQRQVTTVYPSVAPVTVTVIVTDGRGNQATDRVRLAAWPKAEPGTGRRVVAKGRRLAVPLTCPSAAETPCRGTVRVTASPERRRWSGRLPRMAGRRLVTAPFSFRIKPGQTAAVGGWLSPSAVLLLRQRAAVPAVITVAPEGATASTYETIIGRG